MPDDPLGGMPPWWNRDPATRGGRMNRWVWESPRRRWAFLLVALLVAAAILVQLAVDPSGALDGSRGVLAVLAALFIVGLVLKEGFRAVASRVRQQPGGSRGP